MHVIVSRGHGSYAVYDGTVENAKRILSWQTMPEEVLAFSKNKPASYGTFENMVRIIKKMLEKEPGELAFESVDGSVTIPVTEQAKNETILYLYKKKITPDTLSAYSLKKECNIKDLSWLSPFHDTVLVEEWVAEYARQLRVINEDKWKEGISEERKIRYILDFVRELCHRDEEYELVEVSQLA